MFSNRKKNEIFVMSLKIHGRKTTEFYARRETFIPTRLKLNVKCRIIGIVRRQREISKVNLRDERSIMLFDMISTFRVDIFGFVTHGV